MKRNFGDWLVDLDLGWWLVILVAVLLIALLLVGCQTAEAVAELGPDWWLGLENLILAIGKDLWSLIDLFL